MRPLARDRPPLSLEDQTMSQQVDFRVTGRPGATVWRFMPLTEAARTFVDANVELEPSQWHEGFFAVEHCFARDLADLLTEEGFNLSDGRGTVEGK
jgi:hypothetical protein